MSGTHDSEAGAGGTTWEGMFERAGCRRGMPFAHLAQPSCSCGHTVFRCNWTLLILGSSSEKDRQALGCPGCWYQEAGRRAGKHASAENSCLNTQIRSHRNWKGQWFLTCVQARKEGGGGGGGVVGQIFKKTAGLVKNGGTKKKPFFFFFRKGGVV